MLSILAVIAVSAVASASASAATCYKVAPGETGHWENNICTKTGATKEYVLVEKIETSGSGVWCAKVIAGEPSAWSNNICTTAHAGTGEFAKLLPEAPFYKVAGARLAAGEEREVVVKKVGAAGYTLATATGVIKCTGQKFVGKAKIIGSAVDEPGTSLETIEFTGCTVTGNGTPCNVAHGKTITTKPVKDELVYYSKETVKSKFSPEYIGTLFTPVVPTVFATPEFEGTGCELKATEVKGAVVGENLNSAGVKVERGVSATETSGKMGTVRFPSPAILLYETVKIVAGKSEGVVHELKGTGTPTYLIAFTAKATLTGETELRLEPEEAWGVFSK